jgi:hypothetical protein
MGEGVWGDCGDFCRSGEEDRALELVVVVFVEVDI